MGGGNFMNLSPLLTFATDLAYRAGRITLGYFNTGIRPDYKPDDSPVTAAETAPAPCRARPRMTVQMSSAEAARK